MSPGSHPEPGTAAPNAADTRPSPPHGEAAGAFSEVPPAAATARAGSKEAVVVEAARDLLLWVVPTVAKFPRSVRFTLGERIERRVYDILEDLVRANYTKRTAKAEPLERARLSIAVLRHEGRVAFDLKHLQARQLEHLTRLLDDVGKQCGGWLRSLGGGA